ncbi:peptidylprolyl isomerase [Bdellovibrio sp. HCB337]|uniref:peptidylprolyl isomerase n=1 Tax=Bdellovibrio sp. HCB337 TaxID=3394358 RepID=UPI0039A735F5
MTKLLVSVLFLLPLVSRAEVVERIVAVVNNEIILESDFKELQKKLKTPALIDEAMLSGKSVEDLKKDRKVQLDYLINEKIMSSEIKRLNHSVTMERVDQEIRDMAKKNNVTVNDVLAAFKAQGISTSEYQAFLKEKIEKQSLIEAEIISKLRISDDDALAEYLKKNPQNKSSVNEFTVAHIFFNPKKGGSEAAYKRAEAVLTKLRSGENFETLAEQNSEDPNFTSGGLLGTFKSGEFLKEVEDSIQGLNAGQTTGIVKSRMGYHIVKLLDKKLTTDPRFEREKEQIKASLFEQNFKRQMKNWLLSKREEAFVRINEK